MRLPSEGERDGERGELFPLHEPLEDLFCAEGLLARILHEREKFFKAQILQNSLHACLLNFAR